MFQHTTTNTPASADSGTKLASRAPSTMNTSTNNACVMPETGLHAPTADGGRPATPRFSPLDALLSLQRELDRTFESPTSGFDLGVSGRGVFPPTNVFSDKDGIVIASAKYGKGMAVAVIDPWLYNEYTDHRKVHPAQQNFAAGQEFALWLIQQTHRNPHPQQESR